MVAVKWTASLPLAAACFVVGRVALTFYPTVIMTAVVLVGWMHGVVVGLQQIGRLDDLR